LPGYQLTRSRGLGRSRRLGASIMFDYIVSGIVAVLLLVYLGWAMFQPEKF
jgi:K+-transporting ATPase KdpF subunit